MLNIEMLMEEIEDEIKMHPSPERKLHVERILDNFDPNALIELAKAPEDIQIRINELDNDKEEIWEWIPEEANLYNVRI